MRDKDAIQITNEGISYSRGVHLVQRRPELVVLAVNCQGEIVLERRYPTDRGNSPASPHVVALMETMELFKAVEQLRELEPWAPQVPVFILPYETPEAEQIAVGLLDDLRKRARGERKNPTDRGVHVEVENTVSGHIVLFALSSRGERVAERRWNVFEDEGGELYELGSELRRLLDEVDPIT